MQKKYTFIKRKYTFLNIFNIHNDLDILNIQHNISILI